MQLATAVSVLTAIGSVTSPRYLPSRRAQPIGDNMNLGSDIRIKSAFVKHHKTLKLIKLLGFESIFRLITLWLFAAENRPDGNLSNMDDDDIAIDAGWTGETDVFINALLKCKWLDGKPGNRQLHDYEQHQPWIQERTQRQMKGSNGGKKAAENMTDAQKAERSRKAAESRWNKDDADKDTCLVNAKGSKHDAYDTKHTMLSPIQTKPNQTIPDQDIAKAITAEHCLSTSSTAVPTPEKDTIIDKPSKPNRITLDVKGWRIHGVTDEDKARWTESCPLLEIETEIAKFENYYRSNPQKAPRQHVMAALTRWMNRAQGYAAKDVKGVATGRKSDNANKPGFDQYGTEYGSAIAARTGSVDKIFEQWGNEG